MPRYKMVNGVQVQFTAEEETARDAEEAAWANGALSRAQAHLRSRRNQLLAETDWMASSDLTMSDSWKAYRQALRNLPSSSNPTVDSYGNLNMSSVNWPTPPS